MPRQLNWDFWKFWSGETISSFGSSFTFFAIPLLIFRLTESPLYLAAASAAWTLPNLFFGLQIGAISDRLDRKRVMIATDLLAALVVASVPLIAAAGHLTVWWILAVNFAASTLSIFFEACQFGAIPSLVSRDDLVSANGRIQASFAAASVLGPLAAGALVAFLPLESILLVDAASFFVSALTLALIRRPFNAPRVPARTTIRADIVEGLRYVLAHPVLRNISVMMALVNFVSATQWAELVLFAKRVYAASDTELGFLFATGGTGIVILSLAAGPLRRRWTFGNVALGALMVGGVCVLGMAAIPILWVGALLLAVRSGLGTLFNINTGSLRQAIVPDHMLGRIITIARVLAWSSTPLGAFLGGLAIEWTGDVALIYGATGVLSFLIALYFRLASPLGHAERYLEERPVSA